MQRQFKINTEGDTTVIVIPHYVEADVVIAKPGQMTIEKNTVGEIELVEILREALGKRMADRNAKQIKRSSLEERTEND